MHGKYNWQVLNYAKMASHDALSLYLATCKYVIQSNPNDQETWGDLYRLLPSLRHSLSCCVCSKILHDPYSGEKACHFVCAECVGGKTKLKPPCQWCKDRTEFCENRQLGTVVLCYKKLCEYLSSNPISATLAASNNGSTNSLLALIQEGTQISSPSQLALQPKGASLPPKLQKVEPPKLHKIEAVQSNNKTVTSHIRKALYKRSLKSSAPKFEKGAIKKAKRTKKAAVQLLNKRKRNATLSSSSSSIETIPAIRTPIVASEQNYEPFSFSTSEEHRGRGKLDRLDSMDLIATVDVASKSATKSSKKEKPQGCRCGMATSNPGQLTCCGQRCPCYAAFSGCIDCRCRGCRNPRGDVVKVPRQLSNDCVVNA